MASNLAGIPDEWRAAEFKWKTIDQVQNTYFSISIYLPIANINRKKKKEKSIFT